MTEAEWLACTDPLSMLRHLRADLDSRKAMLLVGASMRRVWEALHPDCRAWAEKAEMVAEGAFPPEVLGDDWELVEHFLATHDGVGRCYAVVTIASGGWEEDYNWEKGDRAWEEERAEQAKLVRDIFGNPFRPATAIPTATTPVLSLAQAAYEHRSLPSGHLDPTRLSVLSDSLEEAGCTDEAILSHLRSPGPHVRGCWALDLILGKP